MNDLRLTARMSYEEGVREEWGEGLGEGGTSLMSLERALLPICGISVLAMLLFVAITMEIFTGNAHKSVSPPWSALAAITAQPTASANLGSQSV